MLQAYLRRTETDCRDLAGEGSRVRLCKGAYEEPERVAFQAGRRSTSPTCAASRSLMNGDGYPMVATHDPRMVAIAGELAQRGGTRAGQLRVPDALRHPARRAAATG